MDLWNDDREKKKKDKKKERESGWVGLGVCRFPKVIGGQSFYFKGLEHSTWTGVAMQMQGSLESRMFAEDAKLDSNPLQDD